LLRHPDSVFVSQISRFGSSEKTLYWSKHREIQILKDPLYSQHNKFIDKLSNSEQKEFAIYCMNNYYLYNNFDNKDYHTIFYEELLVNPKSALKEILTNMNFNNITITDFKKPSSEVARGGIENNIESQITKWKLLISKNDIEAFQKILSYFEINIYNMNEGYPNRSIK
jgi:hypothetical protein